MLDTQALSLRAQQTQQALGLSVGTQKQATMQTGDAQDMAFDRIRKNEAALKSDILIADDKERQRLYSLLYPTGGLGYYTLARLGTELADRINEYLTRTEKESELLGNIFVGRTQEALGPFRKVREQQITELSNTDTARDDRHSLLVELNAQCDYNYHLLSAYCRNDLNRPASFWNPIFYLRPNARTGIGQVTNLLVQAHQHRQLYDLAGFPLLTTLTVTLREGGPVYLALTDKTTAPLPSSSLLLPADRMALTVLLTAVPGTGTHLIAYNEAGTVAHLDAQLS